jgi:hypothetical protein
VSAARGLDEAGRLQLTDRVRRHPHAVSASEAGQTIVVDTNEGRYHTLNEVGTRVWSLLGDAPLLGSIIETVRAEYDLPPDVAQDQVEREVAALISDLRSRGVVQIVRRALPILDARRPSSLPPLYAGWVEHILDGPIPEEPHATCTNCAMAEPVSVAATAHEARFDPHVKCCTYLPVLPNYLVGQILGDSSDQGRMGRESVRRRLASGSAASVLGLAPSREYATVYSHAGSLFGKSEALRCPHFIDADGGSCGIWRHRNAVCATYYCKLVRGAVGRSFWDALRYLLGFVERHLAKWCASELGVPASDVGLAVLQMGPPVPFWQDVQLVGWGSWRGREEQFYVGAADLVSTLSWDRIAGLGDVDMRGHVRRLQVAYAALQQTALPPRLRLAPIGRLEVDANTTVVSGYSANDMLRLPRQLAGALDYFDGRRETDEAVRAIAAATGQALDVATLRRLVDFHVLAPVADLTTTELGLAVSTSGRPSP